LLLKTRSAKVWAAAFKGTLFQFLNLPHATPSNALPGSNGRQLDAPLPFAAALSRSRRQSVSRLCGAAVVVVVQTTEVRNCDDRAVRSLLERAAVGIRCHVRELR
jgi:hypothetical protein